MASRIGMKKRENGLDRIGIEIWTKQILAISRYARQYKFFYRQPLSRYG